MLVLVTGLPEFVDPYVDLETGILRNLTGARTRARLDEVEADISQARRLTLGAQRIRPSGDLAELRAIHRHLFQDRIAQDAGWRLDWLQVTGEVNDRASRVASEQRDLGPLIEMFDRMVTAIRTG